MDVLPPRKKDWVLTRESLDKLLACLNSDRERAGEEYENLRRMLVSFFEWRGCYFPEDQADATINRVARRIDEGAQVENLYGYCYVVAQRMALELLREQSKDLKRHSEPDNVPDPQLAAENRQEKERQLECFERCLRSLSAENQVLIIQYYQAEKRAKIDGRATLAQRLGIPLSTLRVRAYRIRAQLDECITLCLKQPVVEV